MEKPLTDETDPAPEVTTPKHKAKRKRISRLVILFALVFGGADVWLSLAAALSDGTVALINAIAGAVIAVLALVLCTEEVIGKVKTFWLELGVLSLGFFAAGQAIFALGALLAVPK